MLRLSKKIEYGLLALKYISENPKSKVTAKEMSEQLNISFEFLSKTLQALMKGGLIISSQGIKGGYSLAKQPDSITISHVVDALNVKTNIVECLDNDDEVDCERASDCTLKVNMLGLQKGIDSVFNNVTIATMASDNFN